jgi:1-deoxy-D-xylulose 5-phosphate reductoisomerase
VFEAANKMAVEAFRSNGIVFIQISEIIRRTLDLYHGEPISSLESCLESETRARAVAIMIVQKLWPITLGKMIISILSCLAIQNL